jgi:preprotein translocase subunit SecA
MITGLFKKVFGSRNQRLLKQYRRIVGTINALEPQIAALSDEELRAKTDAFRERVRAAVGDDSAPVGAEGDAKRAEIARRRREALEALLPEAFAVVREASKRTLGMRHFDVQMIGGIALHNGKIA